jgi:hypothetical protein
MDVVFVFTLLGMTKFKGGLGSSDVMLMSNLMYIPHPSIISEDLKAEDTRTHCHKPVMRIG